MHKMSFGGTHVAAATMRTAEERKASTARKKRRRVVSEEAHAEAARQAYREKQQAKMAALVNKQARKRAVKDGLIPRRHRGKLTTTAKIFNKARRRAAAKAAKAVAIQKEAAALAAEHRAAVATGKEVYDARYDRVFVGPRPAEPLTDDALAKAARTGTVVFAAGGRRVRLECGPAVPRRGYTRKTDPIINPASSWLQGGQLPTVKQVLTVFSGGIDDPVLGALNLPRSLTDIMLPPSMALAGDMPTLNGGLMPTALPGLGAITNVYNTIMDCRSHVVVPTGPGCRVPSMVFAAARRRPGLVETAAGRTRLSASGAGYVATGRRADVEFFLNFHTRDLEMDQAETGQRFTSAASALDMDAVSWMCMGRYVSGIVSDLVRASTRDVLSNLSPVMTNVSRALGIQSVMAPAAAYAARVAVQQCKAAVEAWIEDTVDLSPVLESRLLAVMGKRNGKNVQVPGGRKPFGFQRVLALAAAVGNAEGLDTMIEDTWDPVTSRMTPDMADVNTKAGLAADGTPAWGILLGPATDDHRKAGQMFAAALKMDNLVDDVRSLASRLHVATAAYVNEVGGLMEVPLLSAPGVLNALAVSMRKYSSRCLQTVQLFRCVRCRLMNLADLLFKFAAGDWDGMRAAYLLLYQYKKGDTRRTDFNTDTVHVPNCIAAALDEAARLVVYANRTEAGYRKQHMRFSRDEGNKGNEGVPSIGSNAERVLAFARQRIANPAALVPHTAKDAIPGGRAVGCIVWQTATSSRASLDAEPSERSDAALMTAAIEAMPMSSAALAATDIDGIRGVTMRKISQAALMDVGTRRAITADIVEHGKAVHKQQAALASSEDADTEPATAGPRVVTSTRPRVVTSAVTHTGADVLLNVRAGKTKAGKAREPNPNKTAWIQLLVVPPPGLDGDLRYPNMVTVQLKASTEEGSPTSPPGATPSGKRRRGTTRTVTVDDSGSDSDDVEAELPSTGKRRRRVKKRVKRGYRVWITTRNSGVRMWKIVRVAISAFLSPVLHRVDGTEERAAPLVRNLRTMSRMVNVHNPDGAEFKLDAMASLLKLGVSPTRSAPVQGGAMDLISSMATGDAPTAVVRTKPKFVWVRPQNTPGCISLMVWISTGGDYRPCSINMFATNQNVPGSGGPLFKAAAARVLQALALVMHEQGESVFTATPPPPAAWDPLYAVNFSPDAEDPTEGAVALAKKPAGRVRTADKKPPKGAEALRVRLEDTMETLVARVRHALCIGPPVTVAQNRAPTAEYYQP